MATTIFVASRPLRMSNDVGNPDPGANVAMQEETDEQLIEQANRGNSDAFAELYYRHRAWVYSLARRFTGNDDLAADAVQEVFTYLLSKFHGFRLTAKLTTYLYPVTKHIALTIRKSHRAASVEDKGVDIEAKPIADEEKERANLTGAMAALPEEQREVVVMRFVDGMSVEETAHALHIAEGTVKSRLSRALETLRNDPRARRYFLE